MIGYARPWWALAACRNEPAALFFPQRGQSTREAKAICGRCEARAVCLEEALAIEAQHGPNCTHGIFGGLSVREREKIRRSRRMAV